MLHASAACTSSDVQDECVAIKRRAFHEPDFVLANPLQIVFDLLLSPFVVIDNDGCARGYSRHVEALTFADLDGAVCQCVIARTLHRYSPAAPTRGNVAG